MSYDPNAPAPPPPAVKCSYPKCEADATREVDGKPYCGVHPTILDHQPSSGGGEAADPTPPAGANERLITDNDSVMAWGKDKRLYKVIDRADGVRGHYCVGRQMGPYSKFWEFYKDGKWCSAGEVFTDRDAAKAILNAWSNPQSNPTPPAGDAAGIPEPTAEDYRLDLDYWYTQAERSRRGEVTEPAPSKTGANYHTPGWSHRDSFHRDAEGTVEALIRRLAAAERDRDAALARVRELEEGRDLVESRLKNLALQVGYDPAKQLAKNPPRVSDDD